MEKGLLRPVFCSKANNQSYSKSNKFFSKKGTCKWRQCMYKYKTIFIVRYSATIEKGKRGFIKDLR